MSFLWIVAGIGMTLGPPLVYVDQAYSMIKRKDSTGFSHYICLLLLAANITWISVAIGQPYRGLGILVRAIWMIVTQLALLYLCFKYRRSPASPEDSPQPSWICRSSYVRCLAFLTAHTTLIGILYLVLGTDPVLNFVLSILALVFESLIAIPQITSNYRQKSLYGFRTSTLIGWLGGDIFKILVSARSPAQYQVFCGIQISLDLVIVYQRYMYGNETPQAITLAEDEDQLERGPINLPED